MLKLVFFSSFLILNSCQKDDSSISSSISNQNSDVYLNNLVEKSLLLTLHYAKHLESLSKSEQQSNGIRLSNLFSQTNLTGDQYSEVSKLMGFTDKKAFVKEMAELQSIKVDFFNKNPKYQTKTYQDELVKAINSSIAFKNLKLSNLRGGNCQGIYNASVTLVALAGIVAVAACGPAAPFCAYGATIVAGAAMELARQELIGCNQP